MMIFFYVFFPFDVGISFPTEWVPWITADLRGSYRLID
jgi:hypothetical protein